MCTGTYRSMHSKRSVPELSGDLSIIELPGEDMGPPTSKGLKEDC